MPYKVWKPRPAPGTMWHFIRGLNNSRPSAWTRARKNEPHRTPLPTRSPSKYNATD